MVDDAYDDDDSSHEGRGRPSYFVWVLVSLVLMSAFLLVSGSRLLVWETASLVAVLAILVSLRAELHAVDGRDHRQVVPIAQRVSHAATHTAVVNVDNDMAQAARLQVVHMLHDARGDLIGAEPPQLDRRELSKVAPLVAMQLESSPKRATLRLRLGTTVQH